MTGIIYQHINTFNNKCYIGQTSKSLDERWKKHLKEAKRNSNCAFHCAIRKYGAEAFEHKILCEIYRETTEQLREVLDYYECYYIKYYDSYNHGYNMTTGGDGMIEFKASEETKQKISKANTGKTHSVETRTKISKALKGKSFSEEHRKKLATANKTRCKKVRCIDTGVVYNSLTEAAKINNLNISSLSQACNSDGQIKYGEKYWSYIINQ